MSSGSVDRPIDGLLVIDKPAGPTSHDVVARARRTLGEKRIGHTGTLDPFATGVLPLVIGKATRLASLLTSTEKEYEAAVRFGAVSDTYDAAGRIEPSASGPRAIDRAELEAALVTFRGTFEQMPPPYSAKKVGGVRAYKLAREQRPTQLRAVPVTVHALDLLWFEEDRARLRVRTSPGFYVRSLAHDLGVRLGSGGYLEELRRTKSGRFTLAEAVPLEDLERSPETARAAIVPLEDLLPELPSVRVTERGAKRTEHGNFLRPSDLAETVPVPNLGGGGPGMGTGTESGATGTGPLRQPVRVVGTDGRLLAIAELGADGLLRPSIVLV